jgi:hypothetical protein
VPFRPDVSDGTLDAIAVAIRVAECPDREGPFGLYDYSGYGDGSNDRAHRVRDFRSRADSAYGSNVHVCDDPEEARRVYDEMTRRHVAAAAWDAVVERMASEAKAAEA